MKVAILGRGKVGRGLARALSVVHEVRIGTGRSLPADADIVILAVPDNAIRDTASRVAAKLRPKTIVVHCAGARSVDELASCRARGAHVGAMHPIASFASRRRTPSLVGSTFLLGGDPRAVAKCRVLVRSIPAHVVIASIHGPAYHAAIALLANGAVGLATPAAGILERLGLDRRDAERALAGLLRTVATNIEMLGVPAALTGPIARGDDATVRAHAQALDGLGAKFGLAYREIAPLILESAIAAGLPQARATAIRATLTKTSARRRPRRRPPR